MFCTSMAHESTITPPISQVKLADFGCATLVPEGLMLEEWLGNLLGKPRWVGHVPCGHEGGTQKWVVFVVEDPVKMDD